LKPCGFHPDGDIKAIRNTSLLTEIRNRMIREDNTLKMAICITMYNEEEDLLKKTLKGVF